MKIFDIKTTIYRIIPIDTNIHGWGAKTKIFTEDGILETDEVLGRTREEVEEKARALVRSLKRSFGSN